MAATNVVSELSDTDLRQRLKSFGHNVGPVTQTTRKILEKRLSKFLESNGTNDTDSGSDKTRKKPTTAKTSRTSIGGTGRRSITPGTRKFAPFSSDEEEETYRNDNTKKPTTKSKNDFVDPNDITITPSSAVSNSSGQAGSRSNRRKSSQDIILVRPTAVENTPGNTSSQNCKKTINYDFSSDDDFSGAESRMQNSGGRYRNSDIRNHLNSTNENSIESSTSVKDRNVADAGRYPKLSSPQTNVHSYSTSSKQVSNLHGGIRDEIDASLTQMKNTFKRKQPSPTIRKKDIKYESEKSNEEMKAKIVSRKNISYCQMFRSGIITGLKVIPVIILIFAALFLYTYKDNDAIIGIEESKGEKDKLYDGINCIYKKLGVLAGSADCGYTESKWVKEEDFDQFAESCFVDKVAEVYKILKDNTSTYIHYFEFNDDGDVSSISSHRTLYCRINQAISTIIFRILIIVAVLICGVVGYFIMKKRWMADDEETRQVLHFVERIIDTLQRHHEVTQTTKDIPQFLPIPHVRDMLIPVVKRKKMAKIWQKAVDFLNSSDSRVRVETQRIAGEDFDVWRWIGVCTPKLKKKERKATNETYLTNDQEKSWQGPAFDEIEKVVRMPIVTPTPCLKIRYMHEGLDEKEENWVKRVENAVLEKCNKDGAQILHIFVDKTSKEGCVYVKCESLESAGKAFRCMYGNWFDCRLVIVKFVTLARYHQRFPDALKCLTPLQPDAQMPSSLNWVAEDDK